MPKNFLFLLAFLIATVCASISSAHADDTSKRGETTDGTDPGEIYPADDQRDESILDDPDYDPSHPYFHIIKPRWAFGLRAAVRKVPVPGALGTTFQVFGEYVIPYQSIGLFSIGPHVGTFPLYAPDAGIPEGQYQNAIAGAALRYQLKFMTYQWIVPMFAVEWEYYRVKESLGNDSFVSGSDLGLSAGVLINIGIFDPVTARDAYQSIGLLRTYLSFELRSANINNPLFSLSGNYWLFGLRMEVE